MVTADISTYVNTKRRIAAFERDFILNRDQTRLKTVFDRVFMRFYAKRV